MQNSCPGHPTPPPQFREAAKFHLIPTAHTRTCKPFRQLVGAVAGLTTSVTYLSTITDPCCPTSNVWTTTVAYIFVQFLSCFRLVPGTPSWSDWTKFLNLEKFRRFKKYPNFLNIHSFIHCMHRKLMNTSHLEASMNKTHKKSLPSHSLHSQGN